MARTRAASAAVSSATRAWTGPGSARTDAGHPWRTRTYSRAPAAWGRRRRSASASREAPTSAGDPAVRRTPWEDVDALYPACVAMYTEEVGVSPEVDGGRDLYRARVQQLVRRGWSFSRIEDGRVLFKAEVACATPYACQIQGVYVDRELRGQGLASAGMTTVVQICLREIAPAVSLYVNAHNLAARAAYEHAGFRQDGTFATIMF